MGGLQCIQNLPYRFVIHLGIAILKLIRPHAHKGAHWAIWASTGQNPSSGFPTKRDSNQSAPQLQRLARKLESSLVTSLDMILSNN